MSWFKPLIPCLLLALALSGCGFTPLHAQKAGDGALPGIEISNIPDRDGQYLRNQLIDRLYASGRPTAAAYRLDFSPLEKDTFNFGIQSDATATLAQLRITARMRLVDAEDGGVLLERTLKASGSYNLPDNQLATLASQQDVTENLLEGISDDAVTALSLYFRDAAPAAGSP